MSDERPDDRYTRMRRAAYFQWFRVAAIVGAFLGLSMGALIVLIIALIIDAFTPGTVLISLAGVDVPLLRLLELVTLVEIVRSAAAIHFQDEPEFRNIKG